MSRCRSDQVSRNLATDAWIAETAIAMGAPVVTLDRDFRRFDGLRIVQPALRASSAGDFALMLISLTGVRAVTRCESRK